LKILAVKLALSSKGRKYPIHRHIERKREIPKGWWSCRGDFSAEMGGTRVGGLIMTGHLHFGC